MYTDSFALLWYASGLAMLCAAVAMDVTVQRIPNTAGMGGIAAALMLSGLPGGIGAANALAGLVAGFLVLLPFYLLRVMGAGDVKLLAAVGAFVGFPGVLVAVLATVLTGGVLSLIWTVRNRSVGNALANLGTGLYGMLADLAAGRRLDTGTLAVTGSRIPYAIAIAAGAVAQVLLAHRFGWGGGS